MCIDKRADCAPWFDHVNFDVQFARLQGKVVSDAETECPSEASSSGGGGFVTQTFLNRLPHQWADLADSESEFDLAHSKPISLLAKEDQKPVSNVRWADLVDSETEETALPQENVHSRKPRVFANEKRKPLVHPVQPFLHNLESESHRSHGASKGQGKGQGKVPGKGKGGSAAKKYQCQYLIQIEEEPRFRVVRRLLGVAGANVKAIAAEADAKLRLRGRGSKFLEGPEQQESAEPLMLCLSVSGRDGYEAAQHSVKLLLERIYKDYDEFLGRCGETAALFEVQMHHGARQGSR